MEEFDIMKEFTIYFPNHNYPIEINKYNGSLKKAILSYRNFNYNLNVRSKR